MSTLKVNNQPVQDTGPDLLRVVTWGQPGLDRRLELTAEQLGRAAAVAERSLSQRMVFRGVGFVIDSLAHTATGHLFQRWRLFAGHVEPEVTAVDKMVDRAPSDTRYRVVVGAAEAGQVFDVGNQSEIPTGCTLVRRLHLPYPPAPDADRVMLFSARDLRDLQRIAQSGEGGALVIHGVVLTVKQRRHVDGRPFESWTFSGSPPVPVGSLRDQLHQQGGS